MTANQVTMTGPNSLATVAVPRDWIRNSPTRMTNEAKVMVLGPTMPCSDLTSFRPWKAPSTEMAGVMIESP